MSIHALFPTLVYSAPLQARSWQLNARLLRECRQLRLDDAAGRRWSAKNYPGGYTSYHSAQPHASALADLCAAGAQAAIGMCRRSRASWSSISKGAS